MVWGALTGRKGVPLLGPTEHLRAEAVTLKGGGRAGMGEKRAPTVLSERFSNASYVQCKTRCCGRC